MNLHGSSAHNHLTCGPQTSKSDPIKIALRIEAVHKLFIAELLTLQIKKLVQSVLDHFYFLLEPLVPVAVS